MLLCFPSKHENSLVKRLISWPSCGGLHPQCPPTATSTLHPL